MSKMDNTRKKLHLVSLICSTVAITICLGFIIFEWLTDKEIEFVWITLLLCNLTLVFTQINSINIEKK